MLEGLLRHNANMMKASENGSTRAGCLVHGAANDYLKKKYIIIEEKFKTFI
jgi:hypothetical protein